MTSQLNSWGRDGLTWSWRPTSVQMASSFASLPQALIDKTRNQSVTWILWRNWSNTESVGACWLVRHPPFDSKQQVSVASWSAVHNFKDQSGQTSKWDLMSRGSWTGWKPILSSESQEEAVLMYRLCSCRCFWSKLQQLSRPVLECTTQLMMVQMLQKSIKTPGCNRSVDNPFRDAGRITNQNDGICLDIFLLHLKLTSLYLYPMGAWETGLKFWAARLKNGRKTTTHR